MRTRCVLWSGAAALLLTVCAAAQTGKAVFSRPVLGYVYDGAAQVVRVITGVPGAASLDAAFDFASTGLVVSPRNEFALALGDGLQLVDWRAGTPAVKRLAEPVDGAARIAFSPLGGTAVLYYEGPSRLEVWTGLPAQPVAAWSLQTSLSEAAEKSLAVSDDGAVAAYLADGKFWRVSAARGVELVPANGAVSAFAFKPESRDVAVATGGASPLAVLNGVDGTASPMPVALPENTLSSVVALAYSADGAKLIAAEREIARMLVVHLTSGETAMVECDRPAESLLAIRGNAVFRLNSSTKGTMPVIDADAGPPRVVGVNAPTGGEQ